ncbi:FUSC family protein [Salmonella enterica subsp. enterica]|nr:FUSC family protein [Salmonella enterica subsp. enterica]
MAVDRFSYRLRAHFTNNAAYAFQLSGYTAAIIASRWLILQKSRSCGISPARVCEVIVGILCGGGMMMMILPSTSDGTTSAHRVEKHACALAGTCQSTVAAGDYRRYPLRA